MKNENSSKTFFPITTWAKEDRPREKLLLKGKATLSDAELLAIILGTGSREESAVSLAKQILKGSDNNLNELGKKTIKELMQFKGIGEAKAISIVAAMELGRRRQQTSIKQKPQITSSQDAYELLISTLTDLPHEEFWILLLNRANKVIAKEQISSGGIAGTVVDAKIVFRKALEGGACSIVLAHNHPSGNLKPSQADINLTKKLKEAGKSLDITVLDHLILSEQGYLSFADSGMM